MTARPLPAAHDALEARVGARVAAWLSASAADVPPDITERLRVARERALDRARQARLASATQVVTRHGALVLGNPRTNWWWRLASGVPLLLLALGLLAIGPLDHHQQVVAAAEIDALLLSDELPPQAWADPGFVEFLHTPQDNTP